MKKKVFLMAALATMMATATNAQTLIGEGPAAGEGTSIPAIFTSDNHTKMVDYLENGVCNIYDNSLTIVHQINRPNHLSSMYEMDLDYNVEKNSIIFTQTLFNTDSKYEFYVSSENGGAIMSEDGSTIWSWQFSHDHDNVVNKRIVLTKWDGVYFLVTVEEVYEGGNYYSYYIWYRIDRPTQSITRVEGEMPMNVFPSVVDRSQTITVELGETTNATEVQVVNALGQVVKSVAVQPGQREVQLRASDLDHGVHIVGARSHNAQGACKIIVK